MEKRFHKGEEGKTIVHPSRLDIPLRTRKPTVFAIWNDLFHEDVPDEFINSAYRVMRDEIRHTFLVLTKRPERMTKIERITGLEIGLIDNIWHGLTVCNQQEADEKIPELLKVPGKHFLSIEPMLGPVNISRFMAHSIHCIKCHPGGSPCNCSRPDAVVLGGETGPGARPMDPDWPRSVRDQCQAAGVPFFFKQWGEWLPAFMVDDETKYKDQIIDGTIMCRVGSKAAGRLLDGKEYNELKWEAKL